MAGKDEARGGESAVVALRRLFNGQREAPVTVEGLRDRKKRELRQRISDMATGMFLERGFDNVRVSEVAAAIDVSEKTVFNYFPTKESLVFDREERQAEQIAKALRESSSGLVTSILAVLESDLEEFRDFWLDEPDPDHAFSSMQAFAAMIENTPALTAAMYGMMERLTVVAATVLAERVGVDPEDPEPQQAAVIVIGLWRAQYRAMMRYADRSLGADGAYAAIVEDVRRAAAVAEGGLASFDLVVGPSAGKAGVLRATAAAEASSRQLMAAVKQARDAWKQVAIELKAQAHQRGESPQRESSGERQARQRELRDEVRRLKRELRREQIDLHHAKSGARRAAHIDARRAPNDPRRPK